MLDINTGHALMERIIDKSIESEFEDSDPLYPCCIGRGLLYAFIMRISGLVMMKKEI